jgi:hypothetical protein
MNHDGGWAQDMKPFGPVKTHGTSQRSFIGVKTPTAPIYLLIYLELGRFGIGVLAVAILSTVQLLTRALRQNVQCSPVLCVVLAFMIIYAVAEGAILQQSDDVWFLFTLFYLFTLKETILTGRARGQLNH